MHTDTKDSENRKKKPEKIQYNIKTKIRVDPMDQM